MAYSIGELVTKIMSNEKDVVLLDTCSLLDIVRAPAREKIIPDLVSSAASFSTNNSVWLLASEIVNTEWQTNIDDVCMFSRNAIRDLHKKATLFKGALDHYPTTDTWTYDRPVTDFHLEENLRDLSSMLLGKLTFIENNNDCLARASNRVVNTIAPASKGKDEYKDCMIIEHYLELCSQLRNTGFSKNIVFVSSNKTDFGTPYNIKEPLQTEFTSVQLKYVSDLRQAENEIA